MISLSLSLSLSLYIYIYIYRSPLLQSLHLRQCQDITIVNKNHPSYTLGLGALDGNGAIILTKVATKLQ